MPDKAYRKELAWEIKALHAASRNPNFKLDHKTVERFNRLDAAFNSAFESDATSLALSADCDATEFLINLELLVLRFEEAVGKKEAAWW